MPVPKQRHNKSRRNRRRGGQIGNKVTPKNLVECSNCKTPIMSHRVCPKCGYYKGKEVIDTSESKSKTKK